MITETANLKVGYAGQKWVKTPSWHGLVVWDMLFNGLTTGLFLVAAFSDLLWPAVFAPVARLAYPVALVFLIADLILLVVDLGDSRRLHHMLRRFKPRSPMSLGVWSLSIYSLPLTIAALLSLLPANEILEWIRKIALVLGIVPALAATIYKGVLLSTSAKPGWKDARWLGGYLTSAAILPGCAELIVLACFADQLPVAAALRPALVVLLVVHAVPMLLLAAELRAAASQALSVSQRSAAMVLLLTCGILLPLLLVTISRAPVCLLSAASLILLSNLATRYVIVRLPHHLGR